MKLTHQAGVRNLEREIAKVCRTKAVEYSSSREKGSKPYMPDISLANLETILGVAKFEQDIKEAMHRPGIVTSVSAPPRALISAVLSL